ncbi:MAG: NIPSNAP family protein [Acidobacteriota bacterium]
MILVRNVFRLRFGKAKEAKAHWKEGRALMEKVGHGKARAMVDVVGPFYTFVLELTYPNLAALEAEQGEIMGKAEWKAWYERFVPLVESGHREVYTLLD